MKRKSPTENDIDGEDKPRPLNVHEVEKLEYAFFNLGFAIPTTEELRYAIRQGIIDRPTENEWCKQNNKYLILDVKTNPEKISYRKPYDNEVAFCRPIKHKPIS